MKNFKLIGLVSLVLLGSLGYLYSTQSTGAPTMTDENLEYVLSDAYNILDSRLRHDLEYVYAYGRSYEDVCSDGVINGAVDFDIKNYVDDNYEPGWTVPSVQSRIDAMLSLLGAVDQKSAGVACVSGQDAYAIELTHNNTYACVDSTGNHTHTQIDRELMQCLK